MARHKQPENDDYILGSWEAAKYLCIGINNVRALVRSGILPIYRVNSRVWLFNKAVLDQYRADRESRKEFIASPTVKRREVSINVADVTLSEDVKAFSRLYGRGIVELWALVVAFSSPRTGSIEVPIDTLTYKSGLTLDYVSRCFEFWKVYQWIRPDYEIGRLNVTARLSDPTGAIPQNNLPMLTNAEADEMGDDGLGTLVEGEPTQIEPELTLLTAAEAETVNEEKASEPIPLFGESFVPAIVTASKGKGKASKSLSDATQFKPGQYKPTESEIREVFQYWQEVCDHPVATLAAVRRNKIEWALSTYQSVERCKMALRGIASSAFHQGQNDRKRKYDDIELCFRNEVNFEGFEQEGKLAEVFIDAETGRTHVKIRNKKATTIQEQAAQLTEQLVAAGIPTRAMMDADEAARLKQIEHEMANMDYTFRDIKPGQFRK